MVRRLGPLVSLLASAMLLAGCELQRPELPPDGQPQQLRGGVVTFVVGQHRFLLAAFPPPASLLLVRTGPAFFWATPTPSIRDVFVEDTVAGRQVSNRTLEVNRSGSVDYTYAVRWDR
jgi:hypothetical protein